MIHEVLMCGEENAIPGKALVEMLELKDIRELTRIVEQERRSGHPICATTDHKNPGYFLAENPMEMERYIHSLDRRLKNVRLTREACQETLNRMTGQEQIEVD